MELPSFLEARAGVPGLLAALEQLQRAGRLEATIADWLAAYDFPPHGLQRPLFRRRTVKSTIDQLRALGDRSPGHLWLGDSIFERLETHQHGASLGIHDDGASFVHAVGGDGVEHLLLRLHITMERCFASVESIILMIGINNLLPPRAAAPAPDAPSAAVEPSALCDAIGGIVQFLRERAPAATMNVCHVLPVSRDFVQRDEAGAMVDAGAAATVNARVAATNRLLDETLSLMCRVLPITMDADDPLLYAADGLHLSSAGYERLSSQVLELLPSLSTVVHVHATRRHDSERHTDVPEERRAALERQHAALAEDAPPPLRGMPQPDQMRAHLQARQAHAHQLQEWRAALTDAERRYVATLR